MPAEEESERKGSITALEYINDQLQLEREAKEMMPYDPNECTYEKGEIRQPVFACLTCYEQNNKTPIGICYSCSIQCHSSHELVELFAKRNFECDCGTTRMSKTPGGACKLRSRTTESSSDGGALRPRAGSISMSPKKGPRLELPADDIPSSSNNYNQNFKGLFCSCSRQYNPLEEQGNMIQCYFGFTCGEDWYHEDCILGYKHGVFDKQVKGENILDILPDAIEDASTDTKNERTDENEEQDVVSIPQFPDLNDFDSFICWKCIQPFSQLFEILEEYDDIIYAKRPHFDGIDNPVSWDELYKKYLSSIEAKKEHPSKKIKVNKSNETKVPYSIFLKPEFKSKLRTLSESLQPESKLHQFLSIHTYLYEDDPVYEPPQDETDENSSNTGSLLDLGAEALHSLPKDQAIEGLQAYDKIKSKLRDFFKPFAEQGKVVTEEEVRSFFDDMKKDS